MTAPDSDSARPPGPAPEALAAGQRTLAAIIFTDAVGFSARARQDEEKALRLLTRDCDRMRATCAAFGGQVLKSTGDGLLMLFNSAVQAVACALEIQREFQRISLDLPAEERLQHRIGIHLGDVFQHDGDVMGDGVNIAARLQTEAVPGGICLSNTVYDVVHNRLPFYVNELGERKLKNIGKVTAYQISPVEAGNGPGRMAFYQRKLRYWGAMTTLVMVALLLLGMVYKWGQEHQREKTIKHDTAKEAKVKAERENLLVPASQVVPAPIMLKSATTKEFEAAKADLMPKYDFEGMVEWIASHDWPGKKTDKLSDKCVQFSHLFQWSRNHFFTRNAEHPLLVRLPNGKKIACWPVFGGLKVRSDGETQTLYREQISPAIMAGIIHQLMLETGLSSDEAEQIDDELDDFRDYYRITAQGKK